MKTFPLFSALVAGSLTVTLQAQVVVNEVSASNWTGITDSFGAREDWVELFNTTGAAVNLTGWYLSDSQTNNTKWAFPAGVSIAANGHLIVFCSGRNTLSGAEPHTNYKMSQTAQDFAVLSDPSGTIVSSFQFTDPTQADHSWGRTTDGAANWSLFQTPTPGTANAGAGPYYASKPQFSQPGGYHAAFGLTLSSPDAGVTIRYTTDGSVPTAASPAYAAAINIAATTVVRARCFSSTPGIPPSFVETNTYLVNVTHTIPIISIAGDEVDDLLNGNGGINPIGSIEYFGEDGVLRDKAVGDFNEHGNDSWAYNQRGVDYITRDQLGYNDGIHYQVFPSKSRNKFQRLILKAAANDNYPFSSGGAHIRDAFVHTLSDEGNLHLDERTYEPCVLYMNGQYWGVYEIREKADDADYTKEYFDQTEYNLQYIKTWGGTWSEFGGAQAQTDWNALRTYIGANNMGDPTAFAYVDGQFNWKSLVDYFVLSSYTVCTDWLNWNTAWWRGLDPAGDALRWRYSLWDDDATFGHYINYTGVPSTAPDADPCNAENLPDPGGQGHTEVLTKLIAESPTVHDYYVNRYIDLGNTLFSCGHLLPRFDAMVARIAPEMPGQVAKWGGTMAEWQGNVQAMRDFMEQRCVEITDGLIDCYDLDGPFQVTFNVDPPLSGEIQINSITPDAFPFTGTYYGGITTTLQAQADSGYIFMYWEVFNGNTLLPTLTDSLVTTDFIGADSIVAHFQPPIRYEVMLDVVPRSGGNITFEGTTYENFPVTVTAPQDIDVPFNINPTLYYDFLYWDFKNDTANIYMPGDSLTKQQVARFWRTDTIVAYLKPQDYVYYVANAFTPNGDGYNDTFQPIANVVDLASYELQVFDRWGAVIFETNDPWTGWDGTIGGSTVPGDVYVYRAFAIDAIKQDRYEMYGHVTVIR